MRSSNGCWTCRLRRKKCDERHPVCDVCAALHITCHFGQDKPEWMDGGVRQEEMAEQLRLEVKEKAQQRRGERGIQGTEDDGPFLESTTNHISALPHTVPRAVDSSICEFLQTQNSQADRIETSTETSFTGIRRRACTLIGDAREGIALGRADTVLLMFYLEHLLPFLFPFYRPSSLQGGRAWVLEMMISSPLVRQATLCHSSYFFSLAHGARLCDAVWETVLEQTREAFEVLRQALQVVSEANITEHLHGAVRIMASIMQMHRFEIAILSFSNHRSHLNAAVALFKQLIDSTGAFEAERPGAAFNTLMGQLGPSPWILPSGCPQVPSAEQAAFQFSSALLIFDDIIASTVHQTQPGLYEYQHSLLGAPDGNEIPLNLETVIGCQNWVLLQIGEISVLDAWKQQCKRVGNLDVMELVHRAKTIKDSIQSHLASLESSPGTRSEETNSFLDFFTPEYCRNSRNQSSLVTRVWAHAAFIYLFVVVSGWQPASADVRYHVSQILELLMRQISPRSLLRTMVWPYCVAGCLAEPTQEAQFRGLLEALQPAGGCGTTRKALEIMEHVWRNREADGAASLDLAACFRSQAEPALLV